MGGGLAALAACLLLTTAHGTNLVGPAKVLDTNHIEIAGELVRLHGIVVAPAGARSGKQGMWRDGFQPPSQWRAEDSNPEDASCSVCTLRHHSFARSRKRRNGE